MITAVPEDIPVTTPVVGSTVAVTLEVDQKLVPNIEVPDTVRVIEEPSQTVVGPEITPAKGSG